MLASSTNKANLLGARRPKPRKMWQRRHVKVLVVGDSGLGKTTLVRPLTAAPHPTWPLPSEYPHKLFTPSPVLSIPTAAPCLCRKPHSRLFPPHTLSYPAQLPPFSLLGGNAW